MRILDYNRIIRSHTTDDEDFLQKAKRRLKKYEKAQMYTLSPNGLV